MKTIKIKNYYSIADINIDNLNNRNEIYFLGENGVGKTILLQAIMLGLKQKDVNETIVYKFSQGLWIEIIFDKNYKNQKDDNFVINKNEILTSSYSNAFGYGVSRYREHTSKPDKWGYATLFDREALLKNPIQWLKDVLLKELNAWKKNDNEPFLKLKDVIYLLEEIINLDSLHCFKIIEKNTDFSFEENGTCLEFDQLADGYRSVLIWLCDLISRLATNQPQISNINNFKGIVLVDEIDMFLHPKWEYLIISKLRKMLPNIQWIFTTHSPILILGASNDAVFYKVYKQNGKTQISEQWKYEDIFNLMSNSLITSPLFDLETASMRSFDALADNLDTNSNYLYAKIDAHIKQLLANEKATGKLYLTKNEIDDIVKTAITEIRKEAV